MDTKNSTATDTSNDWKNWLEVPFVIIIGVFAVIFLVSSIFGIYFCCCRKRKENNDLEDTNISEEFENSEAIIANADKNVKEQQSDDDHPIIELRVDEVTRSSNASYRDSSKSHEQIGSDSNKTSKWLQESSIRELSHMISKIATLTQSGCSRKMENWLLKI